MMYITLSVLNTCFGVIMSYKKENLNVNILIYKNEVNNIFDKSRTKQP